MVERTISKPGSRVLLFALLFACAFFVAAPSAFGAGMTSHAVMAEVARARLTFTDPELALFLLEHKLAYQTGVMFPDSSQSYFKMGVVPSGVIDNLTHGNQQGKDGIINLYIDHLREECPGDPRSGSFACQENYAFLLGMLAHDVGDAIPHDRFWPDIEDASKGNCSVDGHEFMDVNVDICLARQLNGNYVNPLVYSAVSAQSAPCGQYSGSFSFGAKCYSCPSGYVRLIDLSWADGTIFENASLPVCVKDSGTRCTPFTCSIGDDYAEIFTWGGCDPGSIIPPVPPSHECHKYSFAWASERGSICPSGQSLDPIYNRCVSCPTDYTRNPVVDPDHDGACMAEIRCDKVDPTAAGFIPPPPHLWPTNRIAPQLPFYDGYDIAALAWPDDPQFSGDSFALGDLKDKVREFWGESFMVEHLPFPWEIQVPGYGTVDPAYVNFESDPRGCDWAYENALEGEAYLLDAADEVSVMIKALWDELLAGSSFKVKRRNAYKYMIAFEDRMVVATNQTRGNNGAGDSINYDLEIVSRGAGEAKREPANIVCDPQCFEANYLIATPFPGETLDHWSPDECQHGLIYRNRDRTCTAYFTKNHPPTTIVRLDPPANANGWNASDVVVSLDFEIYDGHKPVESHTLEISGVQQVATPDWTIADPITAEGVSTLTYSATDESNIIEPEKTLDVKIDRTPPSVSITSPADGEPFVSGWVRNAVYACSDGLSGVDTCSGTDVGGLIDTSAVGDHTFTATAVDLAGNTVSQSVAYRVESLPEMSIIDPPHAVEGNPGDGVTLTFAVRLTSAISFPVTVVATTTSDSAVAGDDFVGVTATLTFNPGETRKDVVVPVIGDYFAELEESFFVTLSSPVNAAIVDGEAVGTIRNDDTAVVPDPGIRIVGCTRLGGPCVVEGYSKSGVTMEGWSFGWYVDGVGVSHEQVHTPSFAVEGTHEIRLDVTTLVGQASELASVTLAPGCPAGHLCMHSNTFEISVEAVDPRTGTGASGVPISENDLFGYFAFPGLTGSPDNPEVFVKVIDGRDVNGHYWFFYGALTDFGLRIEVTNVDTGETKVYERPAGTSAGGFDVGSGVTPEECAGEVDGVESAPVAPAACQAGPDGLCMQAGRFLVTMQARDHRTGAVAPGMAMAANDLFGYFAIPGLTGSVDNAEVFVKVLDGRAVNGKFWVFFAGLTDLEYTLTVTDGESGEVKTYTRAGGSACGAYDTKAF